MKRKSSSLGNGAGVGARTNEEEPPRGFLPMHVADGVVVGRASTVEASKIGADCKIGANCKIGARAVLRDGVVLLEGSVVRADSVLAPFCVYGGSPAVLVGVADGVGCFVSPGTSGVVGGGGLGPSGGGGRSGGTMQNSSASSARMLGGRGLLTTGGSLGSGGESGSTIRFRFVKEGETPVVSAGGTTRTVPSTSSTDAVLRTGRTRRVSLCYTPVGDTIPVREGG